MLSKTLFLLFDEGVLIVSDAESKQSDYPNRWRMFTVTQVEELKILIRIYDMIIVPIARKFTRKERGFTDLQRIGISLFISTMCMSVAAIVEIIRLKLAKEHLTLNIFWQVPQYVLMGASNVFMFAGQLEFFLLPISRCYANAKFILTLVTYLTTQAGSPGWIPNNLNEGHVDYFFWLLAGLSFLNMLMFVVASKRYKQKKGFLRF
ncbi:hypothetical protein Lal_00039186 [Lupinus albus]|nr:hypothetical protein Lal_00039186 [Lupinus albus]